MSCTSAGNCNAAGDYRSSSGFQGMVLTETSGTWAAAQVALPADAATQPFTKFYSMSCASGSASGPADICTAVGLYNDTSGNLTCAR